jgi:hypothetical protein
LYQFFHALHALLAGVDFFACWHAEDWMLATLPTLANSLRVDRVAEIANLEGCIHFRGLLAVELF